MILFIFLVLTCVLSLPDRDVLLVCFDQLVDTNHDGTITTTELNTIISNTTCFNQGPHFQELVNGTVIMNMCDTNLDGVLTLVDWNHSTKACGRTHTSIKYMYDQCIKCGWNVMKKKKK